jgi:hypothetical protein
VKLRVRAEVIGLARAPAPQAVENATSAEKKPTAERTITRQVRGLRIFIVIASCC